MPSGHPVNPVHLFEPAPRPDGIGIVAALPLLCHQLIPVKEQLRARGINHRALRIADAAGPHRGDQRGGIDAAGDHLRLIASQALDLLIESIRLEVIDDAWREPDKRRMQFTH